MLALVISSLAQGATTGTVAGLVTSSSGQQLVGATVVVEGTPFGSMTDANGEYYIPRLAPGTYSITDRKSTRLNSSHYS